MRTAIDFSPLFRSSIGFDRVFDLLENASHVQAFDNWPPYDIAKTGENAYRITMAVAGLSADELNITHEPNLLVVNGAKSGDSTKSGDDNGAYLHRGIATRPFTRRFELADHVKVVDAGLDNGLLTIDLRRELPEEMKPRRIEIRSGEAVPTREKQQIDRSTQAT